MRTPPQAATDVYPDWVIAEMPPGYANRLEEIQRLAADLEGMARFGRLLTGEGPALGEAIRDVFAALGCEVELVAAPEAVRVFARLEGQGRLLMHLAANRKVEKKGPEVAGVFQLLQEVATDRDHVVLVTNRDGAKPPAERSEAITPDAVAFLVRLGVSQVQAPMFFTLWKVLLQDVGQARQYAQRLHRHEGGAFELPSSALV
jgi:hypothetical protein